MAKTIEQTIREEQEALLTETHNQFRKIEELARLGMVPVRDLPKIKRAFMQMESGSYISSEDRKPFYNFFTKLMEVTLNDNTIHRLVRNKAQTIREDAEHKEIPVENAPYGAHEPILKKYTDIPYPDANNSTESVTCPTHGLLKVAIDGLAGQHCTACINGAPKGQRPTDYAEVPSNIHNDPVGRVVTEARKLRPGVNFQKTPASQLETLASIIRIKKRQGGRPTEEDKKTATRAKNELRRRRYLGINESGDIGLVETIVAESFEDGVNAVLQYKGVESVSDINEAELPAFFRLVEAAIEPRKASSMPPELAAIVAADIAKRKAAKDALMTQAKAELEAASKTDLKKSYRSKAFKTKQETE